MSPVLRDQNILVISPQPWGRMFVSKHHYAVELCKRGNRVWFLEPPRLTGPVGPQLRSVDAVPGLTLVSRRTLIPELVRMRARRVYDALVVLEITALMRTLGVAFDVVWSFEPNLYRDLRPFPARTRIYHPVDMVATAAQLAPARTADVVLSVADNILGRFERVASSRHFVNHGLGPDFVAAALADASWQPHEGPVRVGYVGNLFIHQLDRAAFRDIVTESPEVEFHVWGPTARADSNVGGHEGRDITRFVELLQSSPNVRLRGIARPSELPGLLREMDALLLCYDPQRDPAGGANSHKILEYLSSGRVVVANHVSTYAGRDDLLRMADPGDNRQLSRVFRETMTHLAQHNAPDASGVRVRYALANSYERHVERIASILEELPPRRAHARRRHLGHHKEIS